MKKYFVEFSGDREVGPDEVVSVCSNIVGFLESDRIVMPLPPGVNVVEVEPSLIQLVGSGIAPLNREMPAEELLHKRTR